MCGTTPRRATTPRPTPGSCISTARSTRTLAVGQLHAAATRIQHAALAGHQLDRRHGGFFQGVLDEVRIWNVARTRRPDPRAAKDVEIAARRHGPHRPLGPRRGQRHHVGASSRPRRQRDAVGRPAVGAATASRQPTRPRRPARPASARRRATTRHLTWNANGEPDLAGYNVYRSTSSPVSTRRHTAQRRRPDHDTNYTDTGLTNGTDVPLRRRGRRRRRQPSRASTEASATPSGAPDRNALQFDGTNDYVTFGAAPALAPRSSRSRPGSGATAPASARRTGTGGIAAPSRW